MAAPGQPKAVTRGFEIFVATRYLKAKRRQAVISLITVISVVGVAAGVMALVIALAINNGFRSSLETSLLGSTPHVVLLEKQPAGGIANWRELCARLGRVEHVRSVAPGLYGKVMLSGPLQAAEATVKGMPLDAPEFLAHIREGRIASMENARGFPGVVLGTHLARRTGMLLDSVVTVISPQGEMTPFGMRPAQLRFRVVALF